MTSRREDGRELEHGGLPWGVQMLLIFPFSVVSLRKNNTGFSLNFFLKKLLVNLTTSLKEMFFFSKDLSADLFSAASFAAGVAQKILLGVRCVGRSSRES